MSVACLAPSLRRLLSRLVGLLAQFLHLILHEMSAPTREQTQKYERTNPSGFIMRLYRNMWSRVMGIQRREAQYYEGLAILPKTVFYCWALAKTSPFWELWETWQQSGRDKRLTPSVDRIDSTRGYTLDNMQWLTHAENSGKVRPELWHRRRPHCAGANHRRTKHASQEIPTV